MRLLATLRTLLCFLAVAGLIGSAYAPPVSMQAQAAHEMTEMEDASASMADDMPCCPATKPDCAQDCPSLMLCLAKAFTAATNSATLRVEMRLAVASPFNDAILRSLSERPPSPPPNA